jgi:hypothetical protein
VDIAAITDPTVDSRIPGGAELLAFTDAVVSGSEDDVAAGRRALERALGADRMVEAAAVCACLEMMNRITLATGVPLARGRIVRTQEVRDRAGLDDFRHH